MSNDIRNSLGDLGPDTQAAQEAKKKAFPIAYIREGTLAGELEADVVNNGFTIVLTEWTRDRPDASEVVFVVFADDGPMPELTDYMYFDGTEIVHYVSKEDIDNPFMPGSTVGVFGFILPNGLQTGRTSCRVI